MWGARGQAEGRPRRAGFSDQSSPLRAVRSELLFLSCPVTLGPGPRALRPLPGHPSVLLGICSEHAVVRAVHVLLMLGFSTFTECSSDLPPGLSSSMPSSLF